MAQKRFLLESAVQAARDAFNAAVVKLGSGQPLDPTNDAAAASGAAVGAYTARAGRENYFHPFTRSSTADREVFESVVDIQLSGTPTSNPYILKYVRRNTPTNGWELIIYEDNAGTLEMVCRFSTGSNPEPSDPNQVIVHTLDERNNSGISGSIAIRWGALAEAADHNNNGLFISSLVWNSVHKGHIYNAKIPASLAKSTRLSAYHPFPETGNNADEDVLSAIIDISLEGSPSSNPYILKYVRRNTPTNGWELIIYEDNAGTLEMVCRFSTGSNPEPSDPNQVIVHTLDERNNSGISGSIAIRWGALTQGFSYDRNTVISASVFKVNGYNSGYLKIRNITSIGVDIMVPDIITTVVGYPQQIFYNAFIRTLHPEKYNLVVDCNLGKDYRRYWEYTPHTADLGVHTFGLYLYNDRDELLDHKSFDLEVVDVGADPAAQKNVMMLGDSLMQGNDLGAKMTDMIVNGNNLLANSSIGNIDFIGEEGIAPLQYTAYGGQKWDDFILEPDPTTSDYWVYDAGHDKTSAGDKHSIWQDSAGNQWKLETIDGNWILFVKEPGNTSQMPPANDTLTHVSNAAHTTNINYTNIKAENRNPFWNYATGETDFSNWFANKYPTKQANGESIDLAIILLGWNGGRYGNDTAGENLSIINNAKQVLDKIHADYPNCKVIIFGLQLPSLNGGLGADYGARKDFYSNLWSVLKSVYSLNTSYETLSKSSETSGISGDAYNTFVNYVDTKSQFDSFNNMPYTNKPVNLRNSETEQIGTGGIHPSADGYLQLADVGYRTLIKELT